MSDSICRLVVKGVRCERTAGTYGVCEAHWLWQEDPAVENIGPWGASFDPYFTRLAGEPKTPWECGKFLVDLAGRGDGSGFKLTGQNGRFYLTWWIQGTNARMTGWHPTPVEAIREAWEEVGDDDS